MRDQRAGLSLHEDMKERRLWDWGFWERLDLGKPNPQRGQASSIYFMGRADGKPTIIYWRCQMCKRESLDDGKCCGIAMLRLEERISVPPDDGKRKIDEVDCENLRGYISQLDALHKGIIKGKYYEVPQERILPSDLDAAVRALLDKIEENKRVNRYVDGLARRLGWS